MARSNYGKVGGRRSGGAVWQWMIIGITLGLACSAVIVLALLTLGVFNLDNKGSGTVASNVTLAPPPTIDVQGTVNAVVASTLAAVPSTAADVPTQDTSVAPPTTEVSQAPATVSDQVQVVVPPTATTQPTITNTSSAPPTNTPEPTQNSGASSASVGEVEVPALLEGLLTTMVDIPGGTFQMGTTAQEVAIAVRECQDNGGQCTEDMASDSLPPHSVTLDPFRIETLEVTNEQYVAFLNTLGPGRHANGCFGQRCVDTRREQPDISVIEFDSSSYDVPDILSSLPITGVTWYGARAYCEAIGRRLPTEAEWERAARGDAGNVYPWGNTWDNSLARSNQPDPSRIGADPVRTYPLGATPNGIFDMAGNVGEWVFDYYAPNFYSQPQASGLNPTGPASGVDRVVRGGSWDTRPFFARTIHRQHESPDDGYTSVGFRCADDIDDTALPDTAIDANIPAGSNVEEPTQDLGAAPTQPPAPVVPTATSEPVLPPTPPGG